MKKEIRKLCWIIAGAVFINSCSKPRDYTEQDVVLEWAKMATYITQFTPANSPTFASRGFGYIGLTMYESVVHGFENNNSLQGQLNGLDQLPQPENDKIYSWELSLNAGQAQILRQIYLQTSDENKARIDLLEHDIYQSYSDKINDSEIVERSVSYGKEVANAIFEWSKSDGGHRGYLYNFDKEMVHPERPGSWKPPLFAQSFSHYPLHPHWGENRRFLKENSALELPYMIPYDTIPGSPYYEEFMEVYKKDLALTQEEKEAAIWWGDDPDVSFTPPGHSYYYVTLAVEKKLPSMIEATEAYAKTSIAVADAFINCWEWKYRFFSERPNTFIPKFIDQEWESFWPDPPFPAFPSGHAINAGAMATVLEHEFGKEVQITDRAHEGRERDEVRDTDFVVRSFNSFWEAAQETADSRFYGGIHTPQDNNVGLEEGVKIAKNVINLNWRKSD
ncbi:vanadium-dependent haloperoxidase [Flagellimonas flava]|uniref:vanadium-dependent haloperoxidase n=1 Tax=Flagellimonas flava TaxID=570519 RepID=UPI003D660EF1